MELHTQIPSEANAVAHIVELIEKFLLCHGVSEDDRFRTSVCLSEALNNVVLHNPGSQNDDMIKLKCLISDDTIQVEVIDKADDYSLRPDAEMPDALTEDGRGWNIINQWAKKIELNRTEDGNHLIMCLNRSCD